ncbi:uncharacterized protein LOC119293131 isoform X2 [Triticum dicoccoides]|uniref:uncharacterized protein LOC119293131 isoform X2 n=1 Tax=Triticum dicoccoides TaxID=85692 RepID=UPI00188FDE2D|nr:uncharacterized protein LOC119293131 isoform X2 [Triticum dicoccoides]
MDLGPCPKVHSLQLRKDYEEVKAKGTENFDRELEDMIDRLIVECERKIQRALKRLTDEDAKPAIAISVSEVTQGHEGRYTIYIHASREAATCRMQERAVVCCVLAMSGHQGWADLPDVLLHSIVALLGSFSDLLAFADEHLISADMCARKVVGCEVYELVEPPREDITSLFVHAWPLPPALCSGARQRHATMQ